MLRGFFLFYCIKILNCKKCSLVFYQICPQPFDDVQELLEFFIGFFLWSSTYCGVCAKEKTITFLHPLKGQCQEGTPLL